MDNSVTAAKAFLDQIRADFDVRYTDAEVLRLYATSKTIYSICNTRADNVAAVRMQVVDEAGTVIPDHPLTPVFESSNYASVVRRAEIAMSIVGNTLIVPNPNQLGMFEPGTRNLIWINNRLFQTDTSMSDGLTGFRIQATDAQRKRIDQFIPVDEALYLHGFDFDDEFDGVAPAEVAFHAAGTQVEMFVTQHAFFRNRMIDPVLLQPAGGSEIDVRPPRKAAMAVQAFIDRLGIGAWNAGRTRVLEHRWEKLDVQAEFGKLAMRELGDHARDAICEVYQFPPELLTFQSSSYAQSKEAVAFWRESWLVTRCNWYASEMSQFFSEWYGEPVRIRPDYSSILIEDTDARIDRSVKRSAAGLIDQYQAALDAGVENPSPTLRGLYKINGVLVPEQQLQSVWQYQLGVSNNNGAETLQALNQGAMTINEFRQANGLQPLPGLDVHMMPTARSLLTREDILEGKQPVYTSTSLESSMVPPEDVMPSVDDTSSGFGAARFASAPVWREIEIATRKAAKGQAFTPQYLTEYTAAYIQSLAEWGVEQHLIVQAAKEHHVGVEAAKSIQSTRLDYEGSIEDLLDAAVAGTVDRRRFTTRMMQLIRGYGKQAYRDGLADAGVGGELDPDDEEEAESFIQQQRDYVKNVADAIYKDERVTPDEVANKATMWWNMSVMPLYYKGLMSGSKNGMFEWVMGNAEHCESCKRLSGQRRRMKFWDDHVKPKDERLACGGFLCKCNLVPTREKASRGSLPRWQVAAKCDVHHDHL